MPITTRLLFTLAASLMPYCSASATPATPPVSTAPASSCQGDAYSCPAWMPSQAEMRNTIADYFCDLADRGVIQLRVKPVVRAESSPLNCAALGQAPDSNFVCGGEMRFIGQGTDIDAITFSPTLHRDAEGRIAFYEGDDKDGEEVWRPPARRTASSLCPTR